MSANSTVLANLQLQIQDDLNPGQTPVNRIVPQFVFGSALAAVYSGYQNLVPGVLVNIFAGLRAAVVYVRNAGQSGVVTVTATTSVSCVMTLSPGGIFFYATPLGDPSNGITTLTIETIGPMGAIYEYLWAE
jgi:hypothetical protein